MRNNKLLAIRDTILMLLSQWELDADECRKVLQMCSDEINSIEKRIGIHEVVPSGNGKNELAEKTANAKFSAKEEERSLRGEKDNPSVPFGDSSPCTGEPSNQSRPAFGRDRRSKIEVVESGEDE